MSVWTILLFLICYMIAYIHGHVVGSRRMRRLTIKRLAAGDKG